VGTTDSFVNIKKWSDGMKRVVVRDGARKESEEVHQVENVIFVVSQEVHMLS